MMVECLLWIRVIKLSYEYNVTPFFIVYCSVLLAINTISQIVSLIVFSIFASEAVSNNREKILAASQGYYIPKFGSIQQEIIQTTPSLKKAARSSKQNTLFPKFFIFLIKTKKVNLLLL